MRTSLLVVVSVVLAALFGQAPEFAQQYAQRLGRSIDELDRTIRHFDEARGVWDMIVQAHWRL